jgi:FMN reductase
MFDIPGGKSSIETSRSRIVVLCGNNHRPSKSRLLGETIAISISEKISSDISVFDLLDLGSDFGCANSMKDLSENALKVFDAIAAADAVVVSSPTYKGSYPGMFKHFFDLLDPAVLENCPVLLAATGGGPRHALMVEHQLRPLFGFFMSLTAPTAVYASDSDFENGALVNPQILSRLDCASDQFVSLLKGRRFVSAPAVAA